MADTAAVADWCRQEEPEPGWHMFAEVLLPLAVPGSSLEEQPLVRLHLGCWVVRECCTLVEAEIGTPAHTSWGRCSS